MNIERALSRVDDTEAYQFILAEIARLRAESARWEAACKSESQANAKLMRDYSNTISELRTDLVAAEKRATIAEEELRIRREHPEWPPYVKEITVFGMTLSEIRELRLRAAIASEAGDKP